MTIFLKHGALKDLGIPWTKAHTRRLSKAGLFVREIKLNKNTIRYLKSDVLAWLEERIANRDGIK